MGVGQGSYFKGWSSTLQTSTSAGKGTGGNEILVGHVLDVDYDGEPGKIRVRLIGQSNEANDDDVKVYAYPIDQNIVKYPIPGEVVVVIAFLRNLVKEEQFIVDYYYISTVTSNQSITFNSDPYINKGVLSKESDKTFTPEYEHRFEKLLKSILSFFKSDNTVKTPAQLQPYEGDFVLQGRFGATVRLGSTNQNTNSNPWSKKGGAAGNPILVLSANRSAADQLIVTEDADKNDSSIYICSSQTVDIEMATSKRLRSHLYKYDVQSNDGDVITTASDITKFVESPEDEVTHFNLPSQPTDLSSVPTISGPITPIAATNSIPDSILDAIPTPPNNPLINNSKQPLTLVLVDSQGIEKTVGKALLALKKAAANDGVSIVLGSGYRPQFGANFSGVSTKGKTVVFTTQETLRRDKSRWKASERAKYSSDDDFVFKAGASAYNPQTAPPGKSQHGNGIAIDVNVGSRVSFGGTLDATNYVWMIKNAHKFGFVRTVSNEEWHFEYQPTLSANGPYGGIKAALNNPTKRNANMFYSDLGLDKL